MFGHMRKVLGIGAFAALSGIAKSDSDESLADDPEDEFQPGDKVLTCSICFEEKIGSYCKKCGCDTEGN